MPGAAIVSIRRVAVAVALAAFAAPGSAGTAGNVFDVGITLNVPGLPPAPGPGPAPSPSADICISQTLSEATGATVRVVCRSGQFVSIEARSDSPFLGVHGGAFRHYFANGVPAGLRYLGGSDPWIGPGTVTSIRVNYLEGLDGVVEMQVGF